MTRLRCPPIVSCRLVQGAGSRGQRNKEHLTEHLNWLFLELQLAPELAKRILTHTKNPAVDDGHNGGFRFMCQFLFLFAFSQRSCAPPILFLERNLFVCFPSSYLAY
jgi:hypothetical protein